MQGFFVTGTDTGIGKTFFSLACISALQTAGIKTVAMKPVASGAKNIAGHLRNEDALLLQQALGTDIDYELINPYVFAPPVSPHIAAAEAGVTIDLQHIRQTYAQLTADAEFAIVEGVGGWLAPLSDRLTVADMAGAIGLPVVMVVGMRLGCLNHAALTARAIRQAGQSLVGWVANCMEHDTPYLDAQINTISKFIGMPPCHVFSSQKNQAVSLAIFQSSQ